MSTFDPENLTAKIGKLPVWAWGIIGGGAVLGGYYFLNAKKTSKTAALSTDQTIPVPSIGAPNTQDTYSNLLPGDTTTGGTQTNNGIIPGGIETNATWLQRGLNLHVAGSFSSYDRKQALQKYLSGTPLTSYQTKIVKRTLEVLGTPPESKNLIITTLADIAAPTKKNNVNHTDKPKTNPDGTPLTQSQWFGKKPTFAAGPGLMWYYNVDPKTGLAASWIRVNDTPTNRATLQKEAAQRLKSRTATAMELKPTTATTLNKYGSL